MSYSNTISKPEQLNNFTTINPVQPINMETPDSCTFPSEISNELDKIDPDFINFKLENDSTINNIPCKNKKVYSDEALESFNNYFNSLDIRNKPVYTKPEHPEDYE